MLADPLTRGLPPSHLAEGRSLRPATSATASTRGHSSSTSRRVGVHTFSSLTRAGPGPCPWPLLPAAVEGAGQREKDAGHFVRPPSSLPFLSRLSPSSRDARASIERRRRLCHGGGASTGSWSSVGSCVGSMAVCCLCLSCRVKICCFPRTPARTSVTHRTRRAHPVLAPTRGQQLVDPEGRFVPSGMYS